MKNAKEIKNYIETCREDFWQKIFQIEVDYLEAHLQNCQDILSVGCGPAMIEGELVKRGFRVTGLDISEKALNCAPDIVRTVAGRAEDRLFPDSSFDAAIFVASLQFIEDYPEAIKRTAAVLRPEGKIILMLLNPRSGFYNEMRQSPDSYVNQILHTDTIRMEQDICKYFVFQTEYLLGIRGNDIFPSRDPDLAALYVIEGRKR
ncbi:MAG: class I SAM-dependent methyltransferase [Smithellaceae bacterium]